MIRQAVTKASGAGHGPAIASREHDPGEFRRESGAVQTGESRSIDPGGWPVRAAAWLRGLAAHWRGDVAEPGWRARMLDARTTTALRAAQAGGFAPDGPSTALIRLLVVEAHGDGGPPDVADLSLEARRQRLDAVVAFNASLVGITVVDATVREGLRPGASLDAMDRAASRFIARWLALDAVVEACTITALRESIP